MLTTIWFRLSKRRGGEKQSSNSTSIWDSGYLSRSYRFQWTASPGTKSLSRDLWSTLLFITLSFTSPAS